MPVQLLAVGRGMPGWVEQGYREYAKRLPRQMSIQLQEIRAADPRRSPDPGQRVKEEGDRLLKAVPGGARLIALDETGRSWRTLDLAAQLQRWELDGRDLALIIGGADGLSADCLQQAELKWSLSPLTLPHMLVRVLVAEQLYRAWSVNSGHPYHREGHV